jgi:hypothetical protein
VTLALSEKGSMSSLSESELAHMAEHFYGYGRWDAPFWFMGAGAGMANTGDSHRKHFEEWECWWFRP